jgi:hypothetical protein
MAEEKWQIAGGRWRQSVDCSTQNAAEFSRRQKAGGRRWQKTESQKVCRKLNAAVGGKQKVAEGGGRLKQEAEISRRQEVEKGKPGRKKAEEGIRRQRAR